MATSSIQWTDYTFNPWRGCAKVSEACRHCYAESLAKRNPKVLGSWGPGSPRTMAAEDYWKQPVAWNAAARLAGERRKVFCASLADVFEHHTGPVHDVKGHPVDVTLHEIRARLFDLIARTPHLDWLLLTKRPENIQWMIAEAREITPRDYPGRHLLTKWFYKRRPANIWLGITAENDTQLADRWHHARRVPASVHFLSCEPLLGPVNLENFLYPISSPVSQRWVITGGESGPHARPSHPGWFAGIGRTCSSHGVPFFFKQWGEWYPADNTPEGVKCLAHATVHDPDPRVRPASMNRIGLAATTKILEARAPRRQFPEFSP